MITRHDTLGQALEAIESGAVSGAATVVLSRGLWDGLSRKEQDAFQLRAQQAAVVLQVDHALSSHFVEVRGGEDGPSLSTEQPV